MEEVGTIDDTFGNVISAGDMDKVFAGEADDIGVVQDAIEEDLQDGFQPFDIE